MLKWQDAQVKFVESFRKYGKAAFVHEFVDTAQIKGLHGNKAVMVEQPSDYLVVLNGQVFFAEVKSCSNPTSFPRSALRKSQTKTILQLIPAGGLYFVYIRHETNGQWYKVPGHFFTQDLNKKSWKWEELASFKVTL